MSRFAKIFLPSNSTPHLILRDLPEVISQISPSSLSPSIKPTTHNLFTPEPVQGARAYCLHSVLHDWPDDRAVEILSNLRPALSVRDKRGELPKLLIDENVIPLRGTSAQASALDLMMVVLQSAKERSEAELKTLLEKGGFKVTGVYGGVATDEGIVEAVVDESKSANAVNGR